VGQLVPSLIQTSDQRSSSQADLSTALGTQTEEKVTTAQEAILEAERVGAEATALLTATAENQNEMKAGTETEVRADLTSTVQADFALTENEAQQQGLTVKSDYGWMQNNRRRRVDIVGLSPQDRFLVSSFGGRVYGGATSYPWNVVQSLNPYRRNIGQAAAYTTVAHMAALPFHTVPTIVPVPAVATLPVPYNGVALVPPILPAPSGTTYPWNGVHSVNPYHRNIGHAAAYTTLADMAALPHSVIYSGPGITPVTAAVIAGAKTQQLLANAASF